jgi:membrane protein YqaA with SNARE-associated domain
MIITLVVRMTWQYLLVFVGTLLVDIVPFPLPPAFTVMVFLQIVYKLNIWVVIAIGVAGSILGRLLLTLYIPHVSGKIFKPAKNEDVQFLGRRMKQKGWKSQGFIALYSLMPLPTTPLFLAGGMAKIKPIYIIPPFIIGKVISDMIAVLAGKYATENAGSLVEGLFSWKAITGFSLGLGLVFALLFIDWRTLLEKHKLALKFKIFRKKHSRA